MEVVPEGGSLAGLVSKKLRKNSLRDGPAERTFRECARQSWLRELLERSWGSIPVRSWQAGRCKAGAGKTTPAKLQRLARLVARAGGHKASRLALVFTEIRALYSCSSTAIMSDLYTDICLWIHILSSALWQPAIACRHYKPLTFGNSHP